MKIVILGSAWPFRGGLAAYNERLARAFMEEGHSVVIYTFTLQYPDFLFPGTTQFSSDPAPSDLYILRRLNSINPFSWRKTAKEIADLNPDLLLIKFWLPFMAPALGTVASLVKKWSKAKVISIVDNIIPHEKRPGDSILARYFVKRVDGFIAMSESVLSDLRKFDDHKPMLFHPHPLYDNFGEAVSKTEAIEHLGLDITTNYLLFFGFIRDYKGLDLLLRAMAEPEIRSLQLKLIVAGEFYTDAQPYLDLIRELNIEDLLVWKTDFIPDHEVRYYFCAADLVVQPYKHATQSGVTQICYHFDRPMMVTRVGGLPEIVPHGEAGYVTDPEPADIAAHIIRFYREHREFVFRDNIKLLKQKYSWKKMVAKIFELLPN